jgi:hypothetical protein
MFYMVGYLNFGMDYFYNYRYFVIWMFHLASVLWCPSRPPTLSQRVSFISTIACLPSAVVKARLFHAAGRCFEIHMWTAPACEGC